MLNRLLLLSILLLTAHFAKTQPPLDWVTTSSIGGGFQDYVEDVYVDAAGNTYACGTFRGSLTIGSDNLFASAAGQAFIAKYDNTGAPLWAIQSNGNSKAFAKSIFVDDLGFVYVAGYHSHTTLSFAGLSLPSASNEGFYILKVSPSGLPIHLTGPTALSTGKSEAWGITGDGDFVYITGSHRANLSLPGGPTLPLTQGKSDVFLARVDSSLSTFGYAISHGGAEEDFARDIDIEGSNLYFSGFYGDAVCTFVTSGTDYDLPNYGNEAIWIASANKSTGDISWVNSGGCSFGASRAHAIEATPIGIYITGEVADSCAFNDTPLTSGPFNYNDTLFSNGMQDIFVARYNLAGAIQTAWNDGGILNDVAYGITQDASCNQIHVCGAFSDVVNFGGTNSLTANNQDLFVTSYDNSGNVFWAFKALSSADEKAAAIHSNGGTSSFGGEVLGNTYFNTNPTYNLIWNGFNDHFVASFECNTIPPCGPIITNCLPNDTVSADASCSYVLGDYTGSLSVTDGCSTGITVTQTPSPSAILSAGTHEIILTAEDGGGNTDVCIFNIVIESQGNPALVECGDLLSNVTTGGAGNNFNSLSCSSGNTPGEDQLYQLTVNGANQYLKIKVDNVVDANDGYLYAFWLYDNCPNTNNCLELDSIDITTGKFSNNSIYKTFDAPGPGTYYLVIDCAVDSIEQYDIEFTCASAGVKLDDSGCDVADTDSDGIIAYLNGSAADLTVQPCESVTICHDLYLANPTDWEWVDSVHLELGSCYENINLTTLTPNTPPNDNGFVDAAGEWTANYNVGSNSLVWEFEHSSGNPWGDGNTGAYNCQLYTFCFDADIASTCASDEELNIGVFIGDDGGKGSGVNSNLFDAGNSNDFVLQDDNPFFSYASAALCDGDPSILPDSITTTGGTFTASPGIVFTDGSPSNTGEIDLTASTIGGPYTITYEVGLCPFTHDFIVDIFAQEDPAFNYSAASYCQGDTDPVATITGTSGGTFSGPAEIVFANTATGEIDLDASTAGGPYYIVYTTPGPNCINADSVQVTVNAEDDPTFSYANTDYCAADPNETPASITTGGGTFSEVTGNLSINTATGEVDISASTIGNYYVVYTTSGVCPNEDSVQFNILPEDDPSFSYASSAYCQGDVNPVATITGTTGGTFSGPAGVQFANTSTGEIDLSSSTAGGPYTITYTTPGPDCPNSATLNITINGEDDPAFNYPSTTICLADTDPTPTITGTTGGTFTASGGLIFTDGSPSPTGEVDITGTGAGGPFTITYTTPGPDCPNSTDVTVNIYPEDDPTMSYSSSTYCANESDPIPTTATAGGTFTGAVTFVDNATGELDLDATGAGGPYEIVYTSPGPECPNTDTAFITINPIEDATFNYADTNFCVTDSPITPSISTSGGAFSSVDSLFVEFNESNGQIDPGNSNVGGPYTITYMTFGACPDTSTVNVYIFDVVQAYAGPDTTLFQLFETSLLADVPMNGSGTWNIISGSGNLDDPTDPNATISGLTAGTTTLNWTVSNGVCPDASDEVVITVTDLFVPEAITPNGDGQNDLFVINGVDQLENTLQIFNRWGQKVYDAENYQNDWDGTDMDGNELSSDTYFYILKLEDETLKGFIVLER